MSVTILEKAKWVGTIYVHLVGIEDYWVVQLSKYYGDVWFASTGEYFSDPIAAHNKFELLNESNVEEVYTYMKNRGELEDLK